MTLDEHQILQLVRKAWRTAHPEHADVAYIDNMLYTDLVQAQRAAAPCTHEWVDARNEVIMSGEVCRKCWVIRAGNAAPAPETPRTTDEAVGKVIVIGIGSGSYEDTDEPCEGPYAVVKVKSLEVLRTLLLEPLYVAPRTMAAQPAVLDDETLNRRVIESANRGYAKGLADGRALAASPAAPVAQADAQACPTCGCVNTYAGHWPFPKCAAIAAQADGK